MKTILLSIDENRFAWPDIWTILMKHQVRSSYIKKDKWFLGYTAKHDYTVRYINEILTLCFKFAEKYKLKIISPRVRRFLVHCVYEVVKVKDLITFYYAGFFSSNRKQCSPIRFMIKLNNFGGKTLRSTYFLMILIFFFFFFGYWNLCWHISAPLVQNKLCQHAGTLCQHAR